MPDPSCGALHGPCPDEPAPWVRRWAGVAADGACALDLACGRGRHVALLRALGYQVTAVDLDVGAVQQAFAGDAGVEALAADLEQGPWPLGERRFSLVVVVNYLWRPLLPRVLASVAPGGRLVYETFMQGHERLGRPRNPDFLLRPGELRAALDAGWREIAFAEGPRGEPPIAVRQGICAERL